MELIPYTPADATIAEHPIILSTASTRASRGILFSTPSGSIPKALSLFAFQGATVKEEDGDKALELTMKRI